MAFLDLKAHHYELDLFTEHYVFSGVLEPFGSLLIYLNDAERQTLPLKDVKAVSLDVGSVVGSFKAEEVFVRRDEVVAVRLFTKPTAQTVPLMPVASTLRVFLTRFAAQAVFHRGPETRLTDIFDGSGRWAPATDAQIYALAPTKHPLAPDAPMLLVNKQHIRFYQAVPDATA
jgi:hypothetical protein